MSGPVGIVSAIGDSYEQSVSYGYFYAFLQMLYISILLSANLGVMNLLPLPALDGGRLVFLLVEAIRGKKVDPEKEGMVHFAGTFVSCLYRLEKVSQLSSKNLYEREKNYDKNSEDRQPHHWRRQPDFDPVYDQYKNRECGGNCRTDQSAYSCRM